MTKNNNIKNLLKSKMTDYLNELGVDYNQNFSCLNPNHAHTNNTPSMSYNKNNAQVKCFGLCGVSWDIFDLYAAKNGAAVVDTTVSYDFKQIYTELANKYGFDVPEYEQTAETELNTKLVQCISYTVKVAPHSLDKTDYFLKRGISKETAEKFNLGFVPKWKHPKLFLEGKADNIPATPRLIIPTSPQSYIARATVDGIDNAKMKAGKVHLFNAKALHQDKKPVFIVEGEMDALSLMEVAGETVEAVALGSVQNQEIFINLLKGVKKAKKYDYDPQILLALDNDDAGDFGNHQLEKKLKGIGLTSHIVTKSLLDGFKDANELLIANRDRLTKNIEQILQDPDKYLVNLIKKIEDRQGRQPCIPTGFKSFDKALDGGLYAQLYVIGAVSSLGKTTFTLQIADMIARQKKHVFFFSLETNKDTLTEKIISRITFDTSRDATDLAQTARAIDNGRFLERDKDGGYKYPELQKHVMSAFNFHSQYYTYLHLNNGITSRPSANDIYNEVKKFCVKNPNAHPVVIVDYLQILKPVENGLTDKESVTASVAKLNELTEEFQAPVILISSFNRQSYKKPVSMESFKESGEIEYYSDVLLGLQYQQGKAPDFELEDVTTPRNVEAVILKNRNGSSRRKIYFDFYSAFNEFIDYAS